MILTCPACTSRYLLDPAAIGEGRTVRCVRCGHTWFESAPGDGSAVPPLSAEPEFEEPRYNDFSAMSDPLIPIPPGSNLPARGDERRPRRRLWWSLGVIVIVAGLGASLYLEREIIVSQIPAAMPVYEALGLMAEKPGAGLAIQNSKSLMQNDQGVAVLYLEGQIVNTSSRVRSVGKLRATALGDNRTPLDSWLITPSATQLAPGDVAAFTSTLRNPNPAIKEMSITFTAE